MDENQRSANKANLFHWFTLILPKSHNYQALRLSSQPSNAVRDRRISSSREHGLQSKVAEEKLKEQGNASLAPLNEMPSTYKAIFRVSLLIDGREKNSCFDLKRGCKFQADTRQWMINFPNKYHQAHGIYRLKSMLYRFLVSPGVMCVNAV